MGKPPLITVAILEDDEGCAQRFRDAIAQTDDLVLTASFTLANDAIQWLADHQPDVFLSDLGLPDRSGIEAIQFCSRQNPKTKVMVITLYEDETHVVRSLEAGAHGYLLKDSLSQEITTHIRDLCAGGSPITPIIARFLLKKFQPRAIEPITSASKPEIILSEREHQILMRISQGFSYTEIAKQFNLSWHTVHTHTKNIYSKMAVHSRTEAVYEARQLGLLSNSI